jgi:predicted Zn-dependent protease with MMP-like domain
MRVSRDRFEALVADALDAIPPELGELMDNVVVVVEDQPSPEQMAEHGPLFGLYEGTDLTERTPLSYSMVLPDRITIFAGPISAVCDTEEELADEILDTVIHEIAHHFGIDDARLDELGWA